MNTLYQAESLRERSDKGETMLPEQKDKIASISALEAEIASLNLTPKSESQAVKDILEDTDPARLETPNTGALPASLLQQDLVKTSHPTSKGDRKEVPPQPDEEEAHAKTKVSGKPQTVPKTAA